MGRGDLLTSSSTPVHTMRAEPVVVDGQRGPPGGDQLTARLSELEQEYEIGELRLREIDAQQARLRETLLRLSGAIHVLHELLDANSPNGQITASESVSEHVPEAR